MKEAQGGGALPGTSLQRACRLVVFLSALHLSATLLYYLTGNALRPPRNPEPPPRSPGPANRSQLGPPPPSPGPTNHSQPWPPPDCPDPSPLLVDSSCLSVC